MIARRAINSLTLRVKKSRQNSRHIDDGVWKTDNIKVTHWTSEHGLIRKLTTLLECSYRNTNNSLSQTAMTNNNNNNNADNF